MIAAYLFAAHAFKDLAKVPPLPFLVHDQNNHTRRTMLQISRVQNPDAISLDSIHKTVFQRCGNKYLPMERSSRHQQCFVIVTSCFTLLGIIYGFWYKNFGPGKESNPYEMPDLT